jgi:hypothetical protein
MRAVTIATGVFLGLCAAPAFAHHTECHIERICIEEGCEDLSASLPAKLSDTPTGLLMTFGGTDMFFERLGPTRPGPVLTLASGLNENGESALLTVSVDGPMLMTVHKVHQGQLHVTSTYGTCLVAG